MRRTSGYNGPRRLRTNAGDRFRFTNDVNQLGDRMIRTGCRALMAVALAFAVALASPEVSRADVGPEAAQKLYDQARPSLVAVKYTWESELGRRELTGAG